jgi:hypothetical protein
LHIYGHVGGYVNELEAILKQFSVLFQFHCTGVRMPAMKLKKKIFISIYFSFVADVRAALLREAIELRDGNLRFYGVELREAIELRDGNLRFCGVELREAIELQDGNLRFYGVELREAIEL